VAVGALVGAFVGYSLTVGETVGVPSSTTVGNSLEVGTNSFVVGSRVGDSCSLAVGDTDGALLGKLLAVGLLSSCRRLRLRNEEEADATGSNNAKVIHSNIVLRWRGFAMLFVVDSTGGVYAEINKRLCGFVHDQHTVHVKRFACLCVVFRVLCVLTFSGERGNGSIAKIISFLVPTFKRVRMKLVPI
jgi:hypothetical protein